MDKQFWGNLSMKIELLKQQQKMANIKSLYSWTMVEKDVKSKPQLKRIYLNRVAENRIRDEKLDLEKATIENWLAFLETAVEEQGHSFLLEDIENLLTKERNNWLFAILDSTRALNIKVIEEETLARKWFDECLNEQVDQSKMQKLSSEIIHKSRESTQAFLDQLLKY